MYSIKFFSDELSVLKIMDPIRKYF